MNKTYAIIFAVISSVLTTLAEPAQYCNFPAGQEQPAENDFCVAVRAYHNPFTNHHDLYISLEVYRTYNSRGWTAVGIGASMAQALSFTAYGDPSTASAILSVRRLNGHWEPQLFDSTANNGKIEVMPRTATWNAQSPAVGTNWTLSMTFICRSCDTGLDQDLDPLVSMASTYQPWIWAKNTEQRLSEFSNTSSLEMHSLKKGWGAFYMDMAKTVAASTGEAIAPAIELGVSTIATSTTDRSLVLDKQPQLPSEYKIRVSLHGFFMSFAFLLVLPCGIIAILCNDCTAIYCHRMLQMVAMAVVCIGLILGLSLGAHISTAHQKLGLATVFSLVVQATIGLYHQVKPLREDRRTRAAVAHVYFGWAIMVSGCCGIFTGLQQHGASLLTYLVIGVIMGADVGWLVWAKIQKAQQLYEREPSGEGQAYQLIKDEEIAR